MKGSPRHWWIAAISLVTLGLAALLLVIGDGDDPAAVSGPVTPITDAGGAAPASTPPQEGTVPLSTDPYSEHELSGGPAEPAACFLSGLITIRYRGNLDDLGIRLTARPTGSTLSSPEAPKQEVAVNSASFSYRIEVSHPGDYRLTLESPATVNAFAFEQSVTEELSHRVALVDRASIRLLPEAREVESISIASIHGTPHYAQRQNAGSWHLQGPLFVPADARILPADPGCEIVVPLVDEVTEVILPEQGDSTHFVVLDAETSLPLPDAEITLRCLVIAAGMLPESWTASVTTGIEGRGQLPPLPRIPELIVTHADFFPVTLLGLRAVRALPKQETGAIVVAMQRRSALRGALRSHDGSPLVNALVVAKSTAIKPPGVRGTSDDEGRFRLRVSSSNERRGVPRGDLNLEVHPGPTGKGIPFTVTARAEDLGRDGFVIQCPLFRGSLAVSVRDAVTGKPVGNARIEIKELFDRAGPPVRRSLPVDGFGHAVIPPHPVAQLALVVTARGYVRKTVSVSDLSEVASVVELSPAAFRIDLRVVDERDNPIPDKLIVLSATDGHSTRIRLRTDSAGLAFLHEGRYSEYAYLLGTGPSWLESVTNPELLKPSEEVYTLRLVPVVSCRLEIEYADGTTPDKAEVAIAGRQGESTADRREWSAVHRVLGLPAEECVLWVLSPRATPTRVSWSKEIWGPASSCDLRIVLDKGPRLTLLNRGRREGSSLRVVLTLQGGPDLHFSGPCSIGPIHLEPQEHHSLRLAPGVWELATSEAERTHTRQVLLDRDLEIAVGSEK